VTLRQFVDLGKNRYVKVVEHMAPSRLSM
jgi:hypothetical protein